MILANVKIDVWFWNFLTFKVRGIKLDSFEPEILKVMAEIGNDVSKRIYEANVYEIIAPRATPDCSKEIRENWIKAKYVTKAFINVDALKDVKVL